MFVCELTRLPFILMYVKVRLATNISVDFLETVHTSVIRRGRGRTEMSGRGISHDNVIAIDSVLKEIQKCTTTQTGVQTSI